MRSSSRGYVQIFLALSQDPTSPPIPPDPPTDRTMPLHIRPRSPPVRKPQGKVAELRAELQQSNRKDKNHSGKKIALKRIVANMTMSNNDMIALFPDVVNCMNLPSLEVKKMCFLYLVNYARMKPEIALRALPTLVQDMEDSNPLVRALALRTISYIHVREYVEATMQPLKKLLNDQDPYVRKTAAFCVAKLYDHDKTMVEASDLIDRLNNMLRDNNPTVVSSALASLMDIWERSDSIKLTIDYTSASKIVQILPDCSEYVPISLSSFVLTDLRQMGPNLHPRGNDELRPCLHLRGISPRRTHLPTALPLQLRRSTNLHPRHPLPDELHLGPQTYLLPLRQALPASRHPLVQGTRNPIPGIKKCAVDTAETAGDSAQ